MSAERTAELHRQSNLDDEAFGFLQQLVAHHTGIHLSEAKRELVHNRLGRRVRALGLKSFGDYCALLRAGDVELPELINAITTNLTSFFREPHHFEFLAGTALPALIRRRAAERHLRLWSAGCSTGEEAYSMAIVLREQLPPKPLWNVRILASDLDTNVLQTGRAGVYPADRVKDVSAPRLGRWFLKGVGAQEGQVKVAPALQEVVSFRQLNLVGEWPMRGPFDVIFCRNVVIYFDKTTQRRLFDRFAELLADDGYLFIGHSENLYKVSARFKLIGKTIYTRAVS